MADLTITAANVLAGGNATTTNVLAGASITAGQVVYRDPLTGQFLLADSNSATSAARIPTGIALNTAATGQPLAVLLSGPITIGTTVVPGTPYYLSETPGGIQPAADLGTGESIALIGLATSATMIDVRIQVPGVTIT